MASIGFTQRRGSRQQCRFFRADSAYVVDVVWVEQSMRNHTT